MSKNRPIDQNALDDMLNKHFAEKKNSTPQRQSPTGGSSSSASLEDELGWGNLKQNTGPVDLTAPSPPASQPPESSIDLKLGYSNPTQLGYRDPGLNQAVTDNLPGDYQSPIQKQQSEQLSKLADVYDRVSGSGKAQRETPLKDEQITTGTTKRDDNYWGKLGSALNSGIDQLAVLGGSIPAGLIDAAAKYQPEQLAGVKILGDWFKELKDIGHVNDDDNLATQYLKKLSKAPFDLQKKLDDMTNNNMDAEQLGQLAEKTIGLPEEYNPLSPNNGVVKIFAERAKMNDELAHKGYDGGISQAIKDGNYAMAGKLAGLGVVQSLPVMVGLMVSRGAGASELGSLGLLGIGTAGQTFQQLKDENPKIDQNILYTNAILTGLGEAGSELLGTNEIYNQGRKLFKKGLKDEAEQVVKTGLRGFMDNAFKKAFVGVAALDEGSTEAVNQVWKNAIDKWSGVKPDVDYTDGALDAFIIGVGAGGAVAAPFHAASKVAKLSNKNSVRVMTDENAAISGYLTSPDVSDEVKSKLMTQVASNNEAINDTMQKDAQEAFEKLNTVEKTKVNDINAKIDEKEAIVADPEMPQPVKESAKRAITEMEKEADQVVTTAEARAESMAKLAEDVKLADTPEKIAKVTARATELLRESPTEPAITSIVETAQDKLDAVKKEDKKTATAEKPVSQVRKDLMDELDAELEGLKKQTPKIPSNKNTSIIPELPKVQKQKPVDIQSANEPINENKLSPFVNETIEATPAAPVEKPTETATEKPAKEVNAEKSVSSNESEDDFLKKILKVGDKIVIDDDVSGKKAYEIKELYPKDGSISYARNADDWSILRKGEFGYTTQSGKGVDLAKDNGYVKPESLSVAAKREDTSIEVKTETPPKVKSVVSPAKEKYQSTKPANKKSFVRGEGNTMTEVYDAEPSDIGVDGDFFTNSALKGDGFVLTEGKTGLRIGSGATREAAIQDAKAKVSKRIAEQGEDSFYDLLNQQSETSKATNPRYSSTPAKKVKVGSLEYTEIGKNQKGETIYENKDGVRTIEPADAPGIFSTEPVALVPGRAPFVEVSRRGDQFKTIEENPVNETPTETGTKKESIKEKLSKAQNEKLAAAKKAFFDAHNKATAGIDPEILAKGINLMAVYAEIGILKFADIANDVAVDGEEQLRKVFNSLKAAYVSYAVNDASETEVDEMDDLKSIKGLTVEDFITKPNNQENERASESNAVETGTPSIPTGEQTGTSIADVPGQNVEQLSGTNNDPGSEVGNEIAQEQPESTGDRGRSDRNGIDTGGSTDGSRSERNSRRNVPENSAKRELSVNERNHVISPDDVIVPAGKVGKFNGNVDAIFLLKKLENENRNATPAEKKALAQFVGWGGLANYLQANNTEDNTVIDAYMNGKSALVYKQGSYNRVQIDFKSKGPVDLSKYNSATELVNDIRTELSREGYSISPEAIRGPLLKELLTKEEYQSAINSTVSAHYTDRVVVEKMWDIVEQLGFTGGRVSESSAGIGNIFGLMPENLRGNTSLIGYELDSLTGRMLTQLYPEANISVTGFENSKIPLNSVELAISNVPFGAKAPYDRLYPELSKFSMHNYFIGKNLKTLKPGGIAVMLTSSSTLDQNASAKFREWVTQPNGGNSIFVGAIRLPNNAFAENAGTEVTSDILIFQKKGETVDTDLEQAFRYTKYLKTGTDRNGDPVNIDVNEYYIEKPDQMLGTMMTANDAGKGALYGNGAAATLVAPEGFNMTAALNKAIQNIPTNIIDRANRTVTDVDQDEVVDAVDKKEGSLYVKGSKVYQVSSGEGVPVKLEAKQNAISQAYVPMKTTLLDLIRIEQLPESSDAVIEERRKDLNRQYDSFVKKYGNVNGRAAAFLSDIDIDFPIVSSMENITRSIERKPGSTRDTIVQDITKGDVLTKRVNFPRIEPQAAADIADAINISLNYKNGINVNYIAKLLNETPEDIQDRLINENLAFDNPDTGLLEAPDEYLSGYVRDKLKKAEIASENDPKYKRNAEALAKVIPEDIPSSLISYTLGSAWIPNTVYEEFTKFLFDADLSIRYIEQGGKYAVSVNSGANKAQITNTYSAGGKTGVEILNATLNNTQMIVNDTVLNEKGNKVQRKNPEKTAAAQGMQQQIQDEFQAWIRNNEAVQIETERIYNDIYNGQVLRDYVIPSFEFYPGANHSIKLREHQKRAVSRGLSESALFAHSVGSGKTFTMITTAMEMRRLGTAKKPLVVVQNSTRGQFISSFKKLYPAAKLLAASEKELSADGRKKFFAKIATGDWDAIIIPQSQLSMIPDDPTRQMAYIQEQIDEIQTALSGLNKYSNRIEYNQLEGQIKKLNEEYGELTNVDDNKKRGGKSEVKRAADKALSIESNMMKAFDRRTDDIFNFEELGVDALLVDEAHAYKRLGFQTSMKNIKGIDTSKSKRSQSVLLKTRWIQEKTGGKNVLFYTGTPISNTMAEAWTMMKYVRPDILEHLGIEYFDQFAKTFGQVVPSLEQSGGGTFKVQSRFAKFQNLPEFIAAFRAATDVVLSEDVKEFQQENALPKLKDNKITQIVIPQSPELKNQIKQFRETLEWFDKLSGQEKRENSHIPLVIFNKAKQSSIDLRLLNPVNVDTPNSKVNQAIQRAVEIYKATLSKKGVQMIFSDMYQSPEPKDRYLDEDETIPNPAFGTNRFNLFQDIKEKLIANGVNEAEIAMLNEAKWDKPERKEQLFNDANEGKVRFLLGSTEKMGVGVNAQRKMVALHHLDAPARPMDFEQRNGRIIRQGNENEIVEVLAYGVEKTLDSSAFQRLSTKQKFINQVMKGENIDRVTEDPADEVQMTFDEMMAQLSDSPYAMQKLLVDNKLRSEGMKRENFKARITKSNSELREGQRALDRSKASLVDAKEYAAKVEDSFKDGNVTSLVASGVEYTEKFGIAADSYLDMLEERFKNSPTYFAKGAIQINGLQVQLEIRDREEIDNKTKLLTHAPTVWYTIPEVGIVDDGGWSKNGIEVSSGTGMGLMTSIRSKIDNVLMNPGKIEQRIERLETDLVQLRKDASATFDDSTYKQLEAESESLKEKMLNDNSKDDDDPDGGGEPTPEQSDAEYILDQSNVKPLLDALDRMKVSSGKVLGLIVPIPPAVWNGAIEVMKAVVKSTNSTQKAIRVAAKYIINQGGNKAQAEDFTQQMNNAYGPGTPLAEKLNTIVTRITEAKADLSASVQDIADNTSLSPKEVKARLVEIMQDARKSDLIKQGIAKADNAANAIQKTAAIVDDTTAAEAIQAVQDFVTHVGYNNSLKYAMNAYNRLNAIEKKNKMALSVTSRQLANLDPKKLTPEELDEYLELAPVLVTQLDGKDAGLIADTDIADFLDKVVARQDAETKKKLIDRYKKLNLDETMSIDEMLELISESKEDKAESKNTRSKSEFDSRESKKREILTGVLEINREDLANKTDIPAEKKFLTQALINLDISKLSTGDMVRLNQVVANIVYNDRYTGAGYFSKVSQGIQQLKKYAEAVGRLGGFRPITYDSFIKDKFKGTNLKSLSLTDKFLHLNTFEEIGVATDEMLAYPIGNGYSNQKAEMKVVMDGLDKVIKDNNLTKDRLAIYRVGVFAELNAYVVGAKQTPQEQFMDAKSMLKDSIEALETSKNKYEQNVYGLLNSIWEDVEGANSVEDIEDMLSPEERKVYDYIHKIGKANFNRLFDNNEMYGDKPMKEKANYVHRRYMPLQDGEVKLDLVSDDPINASANGVLGQSGTKKDVLARRVPKGKFVDYNIYKSFRVGLNETLNDIYTLGDRIKSNYILNSPEFERILSTDNDSGRRNLNILKDSIKQMVNIQRGVSKIDMDMYGGAAKLMNFFRQTFYSGAVGTATAAVPQYLSSAVFTMTKLNKPSSYMQSLVLFAQDSSLAKKLIEVAGSGTANRDLQGDAQLEDAINNLSENVFGQYISPKISEIFDKLNGIMFASLKYGDRVTSLHTWVAGYIDNLIDQGVIRKASEFTKEMLDNHISDPNTMAATSAENMVTLSNNESDASRKANRFVNKSMSQEWINDLLYPVKKFAVAMNNKLWLGIRNLTEWDGGQAEGARLVFGALGSIAIYGAIRDFVINKFIFDLPGQLITGALGLGDDDEKEEQERLKMTDEQYKDYKADKELYKFGSETISDTILGGQNVVVEKGIKNLVNLLWKTFGEDIAAERKEQKKYTPVTPFYMSNGVSSMLGVYGRPLGLIMDINAEAKSPLNVLADVYREDDATDESRLRRLLFSVGIPVTTQFLLPSADIERLNNRIKKRVERVDEKYRDIQLRDKKNKDYKKYNSPPEDQAGLDF